MTGSVRDIIKTLNRADAVDIDEGRLSYFRYNEVLRNLAAFYSVGFAETVAVFAALSPNSDYQGNLRSTATVIKGWKAGVDVERIRVVTYNHCRDRAFEYLNGVSFLETVKGKKIRSFYLNILNPMDPEPVTIDGHAVNIWRGRRMNLKEVAGPKGRFNYNEVARDYRSAAIRVGLLPNQVQAITWFTWKRVHSILFPGRQLELLRDNSADLWRTIVDPESIVPFEFLANPSPSHLPARRIRDPRQTAKIQNGKRKTETRA
jgi:hypothetical protein